MKHRNARKTVNPPKTHCKWGHELKDGNLSWEQRGDKKIRRCKTCVTRRNKEAIANRGKPRPKPAASVEPTTHPAILLYREELAKRIKDGRVKVAA